jgi:hypothetical protein
MYQTRETLIRPDWSIVIPVVVLALCAIACAASRVRCGLSAGDYLDDGSVVEEVSGMSVRLTVPNPLSPEGQEEIKMTCDDAERRVGNGKEDD